MQYFKRPPSVQKRTKDLFEGDYFQATFSGPDDEFYFLQTAHEKLVHLRGRVNVTTKANLRPFIKTLREEFEKLPRSDDELPENVKAVFAAIDEVVKMLLFSREEHKYHNNIHTLVVTANRLMLGLVEHKLRLENGYGNEKLSARELYQLARGCLICLNHDNGHNGVPNNFPMERETYSNGLLDPVLRKHEFDDEERKFIERVTLLTDPRLPGEILKFGASLHGFTDNIMALPRGKLIEKINGIQDFDTREKLHDLLKAVIADPSLVHEALLTKAADMAFSFGLRNDYWLDDGKKILEEEAKANSTATLVDMNDFFKRQYWVFLNFVGAKYFPDGIIEPSFMHKIPDLLFSNGAKGIKDYIGRILPKDMKAEVERALEATHTVLRGEPTTMGIRMEPKVL